VARHGLEHPDLRIIRRVRQFMMPYSEWPVDLLGPDELNNVKRRMLRYKYKKGNTERHYTRRGIMGEHGLTGFYY